MAIVANHLVAGSSRRVDVVVDETLQAQVALRGPARDVVVIAADFAILKVERQRRVAGGAQPDQMAVDPRVEEAGFSGNLESLPQIGACADRNPIRIQGGAVWIGEFGPFANQVAADLSADQPHFSL